jgi:hypothetical protein
MERKQTPPDPTAKMQIGNWLLHMSTRRIKVRTERDVHLSDNSTGHGLGTLLRTEKHQNRMVIHEVRITHENGDSILFRRNDQGRKTTCTRTVTRRAVDVDLKPIADKPESYGLDKAAAYLGRVLNLDPEIVLVTLLAPLEEGQQMDLTNDEIAGVPVEMVEA